jgi:hypothetical protein
LGRTAASVFRIENWGSRIFGKVCIYLPNYTSSYSRRLDLKQYCVCEEVGFIIALIPGMQHAWYSDAGKSEGKKPLLRLMHV